MDTKKDTKQVVLTRTFPAGIERLWDAFTKVEDMLKWHSPVGMTTPHAEVDLRVGGKYAISMQYVDTKEVVTVRGVYKVIEKPTKLVYTWKWDGSEEETEVSVLLHAESYDKTLLTLIHSGFSLHPTASDVKNNRTHESHKLGWTTGFDKLEELVAASSK
jgi:uncharacterized protein YndB with AHSA1/START domain